MSFIILLQLLGPGIMVGVAFLYMERTLARMLSWQPSLTSETGVFYVALAMMLNAAMILAFWYIRFRIVFNGLRSVYFLARSRAVYQAFCILTVAKVGVFIVAKTQSPEGISLVADGYTVLMVAMYCAYTFYLSRRREGNRLLC